MKHMLKLHSSKSGMKISRWFMLSLCVLGLSACSLDNLVSVDDPEGEREVDRGSLNSLSGGISLYHSSLGALARGISDLSRDVGLLTDELQIVGFGHIESQEAQKYQSFDARLTSVIWETTRGLISMSYSRFYGARTSASQARHIISRFDADQRNFYLSAAYAVEAQAILSLAENFCSGVPLTKAPFEGDIEYTDGFSTEELLENAVALFDSSLALQHDSIPILTLARVGKARALLSLNRYQEAAEAVESVQPGHSMSLTYTAAVPPSGQQGGRWGFWTLPANVNGTAIGNMEGTNGLLWLSVGGAPQDPRVPIRAGTPPKQNKFPSATLVFSLARWVDVLMIRAEASLERSPETDEWLDLINEARATVPGLSDTTDPGNHDARVNLLFRERAFWSYLQGTRLADYRRLVRQYNRSTHNVYPSGSYNRSDGSVLSYGDAFVFSPTSNEFTYNSAYSGCIHTNP